MAFVPIIIEAALFLAIVAILAVALVRDLLYKGFTLWLRDSFGSMLQKLVIFTCICTTLVMCRTYIKDYEQDILIGGDPKKWGKSFLLLKMTVGLSMWTCFVPLLVLSAFCFTKTVLLKQKNTILNFVIAGSILSIPFCIESYFDKTVMNAPLWITALPFCLIVFELALTNFIEIEFSQDFGQRLFRCHDHKFKRVVAILNLVSVFGFSVAIMVNLYNLSQAFTDSKEGKFSKPKTSLDA